MLEHIIEIVPWIVILVVYIGEKFQQFQLTKALNAALQRAQEAVHASIPSAPPTPPAIPTPSAPPTDTLVLDSALVTAVKKFEGFAPKAKWDYKQYTNGYGTKALSADEVIDEPTAEKRLLAELSSAMAHVQAFAPNAPKGLQQALIDLTLNAGPGWEKEGLGTAVHGGDPTEIKKHLLQYTHAGGKVLDDLVKRREAEAGWIDHPL